MHEVRQQSVTRALAVVQALALPHGTALVATGSLARGEMTAYSDIDLILLHDAAHPPSEEEVSALWYPIWDAKLRLDYSVRTPAGCVDVMKSDSTAGLALLDMAFIAGDEELFAATRAQVLQAWRRQLAKNFDQVVDLAIARWRRSGSMVTMTHPDVKHGRGGLRDIELIHALALGNLCDAPDLSRQRNLLLDVRTMLHQHAHRARDVLDPEFAIDVAIDLGFTDRYELSRALAAAAREVDAALNTALDTARHALPRRGLLRNKLRRPIDVDVVEAQGRLELARQPNLEDPGLLLRIAAASARTGLPIAQHTWEKLKALPALQAPWPETVAYDFFALLSSPDHSAEVITALDEHGLWEPLVPWWAHIRGRMPREPIHIHTIDQHSLVVLGLCASESVNVARPDLLFLAALFHDIGKGHSRPHEEVGAEMVKEMAAKLGLNAKDTAIVNTLVAQHTLIPQLVRTTDFQSEETLQQLLDALNYDLLTLELLDALVRADAQGTGPGVWSPTLRYGTEHLVQAARGRLAQVIPEPPEVPEDVPEHLALRASSDVNATIVWRGTSQSELQEILAVVAAMQWNVECVAMHAGDEIIAELEVYNLLGNGFDEQRFVQVVASKVHSQVPAVEPGMVATLWQNNILEVRTPDRIGAFAVLLDSLPAWEWVAMENPGATMMVRCQLADGFTRVQVERAVAKALAPS